MPLDLDMLRALTQTPGIASREDKVRDVVATYLGPLVDDLSVDALGNLIGHRKGSGGPRIAIAAHIDEIGFLVRHVDDNGFLRVQRVGGFDPRVLVAQRVQVHTRTGNSLPGVFQPASKPIHLMQPGEAKDLKLEDLFVDLGMTGDVVKEQVRIGDMVTLDRNLIAVGDTVVSKALDDRLGVYVMIQAVMKAVDSTAEIFAIATTQEEIGLRGAQASAYNLDPDIAIALDVTIAGDIPGGTPDAHVTKLGAGTAIKILDSSQIANPMIVDHLRDLAEERGIAHQLEILPFGGTDAGAFQTSRGGMATGTISIPTRYVHTVNEMAHVNDIQASVDLLAAFLNVAGTRSYGYSLGERS
ncbi:MAG: M42 family metallopeptidase [Chloroflexota bacterium]|nr:M42 family metallopeptidase [Chloroflexota bacterium]